MRANSEEGFFWFEGGTEQRAVADILESEAILRKYEESESWSEILGNDCDDTFQAFWMIDVDPAGARDPHDFKDGHIAAQMVVNHAVTVNTTVLELGTLPGDQSSVDFLDRTGGVPMRNIFKRVTKEAPLAMSVDLINAPLLKRIMSGDSVPLVGSPSWVCVCTFVCDNATKKSFWTLRCMSRLGTKALDALRLPVLSFLCERKTLDRTRRSVSFSPWFPSRGSRRRRNTARA